MLRTALFILIVSLAAFPLRPALCQPAAAASSAAAISPTNYENLVRDNLELRRELTRITGEINEIRKKNAALVLEVQDLQQSQATMSALLAETRAADDLKKELTQLRAERQALLNEVARLNQELQRVATAHAASLPATPAAAPQPGSDLYRKLENENADLRERLAKAKEANQAAVQARDALSGKTRQFEAKLEQLTKDNAGLRRQLDDATAQEQKEREALLIIAKRARGYLAEIRRLRSETSAEAAAQEPKGGTGTVRGATAGFARPGGTPIERQTQDGEVTDVQGLMTRAENRIKTGRYREAERAYLVALKKEPGNASVHYSMGVLYDDYLNDPRKAASYYRKYLELNPSAPDRQTVQAWLVELDLMSR